ITVHDQADSLERNLPAFLSQDYPDYRVVVVGEKGDSETEDILKRLAARHSRLYYTLIPESSRYMSRKKLQVTLGVKAAGSEWIVLTEATMRPQSDRWLATMATHFADDCNLVMGYAGFDDATPGYRRFIRLREACYLLRRARRGRALSTNMANLAFRKSDFLRHNGFRGNLQLVRGEYEFLVNR
ncbi:glycosyltransferase, partial [Segatella buccae]|uniref:glycosyltransferase n=1 Tax=Segatella buccae TaxID=28126 RepID=UPI00066109DB